MVEATLEAEPALAPEEPAPAPAALPAGTDRIALPRIGVDVSVVDVGLRPSGEMETASFAAGRLALSAQAGEAGNAVIAGHNDVEGEVFRRLPEMRPGDDVILYRGDRRYRYTVVVRTIVREEGAAPQQRYENARWMEPTDRGDDHPHLLLPLPGGHPPGDRPRGDGRGALTGGLRARRRVGQSANFSERYCTPR